MNTSKPKVRRAKHEASKPSEPASKPSEPAATVGPQSSGTHRFGDFRVPADRQIKGFANAFS